MAPKKTRQLKGKKGTKKNFTRKMQNGKGKVLDVRSPKDVALFEKLIVNGPLTFVYVNAKWCGACHQFTDKVWSSLTKLKNKGMNLASVDSEMIGKTSLANVPRKFYPTLMLVGKDKKPATFIDEEGNPTAAMPRNASLEEDREAFTSLVKNPSLPESMKPESMRPESMQPESMRPESMQPESMKPESMRLESMQPESMKSESMQPESMQSESMTPKPMTLTPTLSDSNSTSLPPEAVASQPIGSQFITKTTKNMKSPIRLVLSPFSSNTVPSSMASEAKSQVVPKVPNISSDLIKTRNTLTPKKLVGGERKLLNAIKAHTNSLKALLKLRHKV